MTTIAFLGLGNMGGPMAANLAKAGHEVIGFGGIERVGAQPFSKLLQGRFIGTER